MRLKNIYKTLKEIEPIIKDISHASTSNGSYEVRNWNTLLKVLDQIRHIEIFESAAQELFAISPIFGENVATIRLTETLYSRYSQWLRNLKNKIEIIIELCESLGYDKSESGFEVKLPETNDLGEFASNVDNLNKAIQLCPFIKEKDADIRLVKTDIGSTWLEFAIIGAQVATVLTALGYFAKSALKIKSMYITCEQQKEAVKGAQIKNNLADEITNLYKDIIKATAVNEVKNLEEKLNKPLNPEDRTSAEKSLEILGKLMSKGLEIYATLDSPPEAKDVFPTADEQKLLPGILKLLPSSTNEDEGSQK